MNTSPPGGSKKPKKAVIGVPRELVERRSLGSEQDLIKDTEATRGVLLRGVALYTALIGFCVAVYAALIWLYLTSDVWFTFVMLAIVALLVAVVWDDIFFDTDDDVPVEWPRLRRVK